MSKAFRQEIEQENPTTTGDVMRVFCCRPGKEVEPGKPQYTTEQAHRKMCDVNEIIRRYDKTGLIEHVQKIEAQYGDMTGLDFQTAQNKIAGAYSQFNKLPAKIRHRFRNDPAQFLQFFEKAENRDEAIKLGLIRETTRPEHDGLGEHVTTKPPDPGVVTPTTG